MAKKFRHKRVVKKPKTRKELRKEKRLQKKENKRNYFGRSLKQKTDVANQCKVLAPASRTEEEEIDSDFSDQEVDKIIPKSVKVKQPSAKKSSQPNVEESRRRELAKLKDLEGAAKKQRIKQLRKDNEEEDIVIARLEKKLKIKNSKDKNRLIQKMFNDDLGYALELCTHVESSKAKEAKVTRTTSNDLLGSANESCDEEEFGDIPDYDGEDSDQGGSGEEELNDIDDGSEDECGEKSDAGVKEDIYGRKRDAEGNIISESKSEKYVPPHQRAAMSAENVNLQEQLSRLRKTCKGFLNRLSETNLHKIATSIEQLYLSYSRHDTNKTLFTLFSDALLAKTLCKERMVQEHIVLLSYLHASVGSEIGAHFLQMFVKKFDDYMQNVTEIDVENKELNNLILILAYFYMFKVFQFQLLFEIIDRLTSSLCEKTVECLLLIIQSVGFKLRKDDPAGFKNMFQTTQRRISESSMEMKENLRLKYMVDMLTAVKNNNIRKIPQFDPELGENLRKKLKAMLTNNKQVVTLNITITDLLRADEVGKWWIVGSAWSGNINDINAANKPKESTEHQFSEKLLDLAKKMKMNTEERKNIFCLVMGADNYMDGFEKIMRLGLKDPRNIASVIIHCCLSEPKYNPYYALLSQKFALHDRKYLMAFQFACWDRINNIKSLSSLQIKSLANFLLHLISLGAMPISALKVIDFVNLDKNCFDLMKRIIIGLLLTEDIDCQQIFGKVARNPKLKMFKNSIQLFMEHFLLKDESALKLDQGQLDLLKTRINTAKRVITRETLLL